MAFDGVPWLVNGGDVDASAARAAHYAATRGAHGMTLPGDFKVSATPTASQSVRIATGSMTILNAQAAGESYQALARSTTDVGIDVTGATRYDLVIARIVDPDFAPWTSADVPDAVNGPYFQPHVIKGVAAGTTKASDVVSYSAEALARIAVPASGNITNTMITPLRKLAQPRSGAEYQVQSGVGNGSGGPEMLAVGDTAFKNWPSNSFTFDVPEWATHAQASILLNDLPVDGPVDFDSQILFGSRTGFIALFDYNGNPGTSTGYIEHLTHATFWEFDVSEFAGETVTMRLQARRTNASAKTGNIGFGTWEQVVFDVRFSERVS